MTLDMRSTIETFNSRLAWSRSQPFALPYNSRLRNCACQAFSLWKMLFTLLHHASKSQSLPRSHASAIFTLLNSLDAITWAECTLYPACRAASAPLRHLEYAFMKAFWRAVKVGVDCDLSVSGSATFGMATRFHVFYKESSIY